MAVLTEQAAAHGVLEESSTQEHRLGTLMESVDGRLYRYCKAGGTALNKGELQVTADIVSNHENMAVATAASAGETSVEVTLGGTAVTEDQYAGGYLVINDADGEGTSYLIKGHAAQSSTTGDVTIELEQPLDEALTTSSEASLIYNPYAEVQQSNADQADMPVGIPNIDVTADYYFWCQTKGECAALADEALTRGKMLTIGSSTAGTVEVIDALGEPLVGVANQAGVDTEFRSINLQID